MMMEYLFPISIVLILLPGYFAVVSAAWSIGRVWALRIMFSDETEEDCK